METDVGAGSTEGEPAAIRIPQCGSMGQKGTDLASEARRTEPAPWAGAQSNPTRQLSPVIKGPRDLSLPGNPQQNNFLRGRKAARKTQRNPCAGAGLGAMAARAKEYFGMQPLIL